MELNYRTAKLIRDIAYNLNEVRLCDSLIESFGNYFLDSYRGPIKKINKLSKEFKKHYNMSNRKYNAVIYKLVCSQFINFKVFSKGEDYDEALDGPLHPVFNKNWLNTLNGYQPQYMLSKDMISMKFGSLRTPLILSYDIRKYHNSEKRRKWVTMTKEAMVTLCYKNGSTISVWAVQANTVEDVYKNIRKSVGPEMSVDKKNPYIMYGYGDLVTFISQLPFEE